MRDPTFKETVENILDTHPWLTIDEIREKCRERGLTSVERVQAQIDMLARSRVIHKKTSSDGRSYLYALGGDAQITKMGGIEIDFRVVNGEIKAVVRSHKADLHHKKFAEYIERYVKKLETNLEVQGRGLLFEAASDLGLLYDDVPDFVEDESNNTEEE